MVGHRTRALGGGERGTTRKRLESLVFGEKKRRREKGASGGRVPRDRKIRSLKKGLGTPPRFKEE